MAPFRREEGTIDQRQALSHPLRLAILELFTHDEDRSLTAVSLSADLRPLFSGLKVPQVAYHLSILKGAKLLPGG